MVGVTPALLGNPFLLPEVDGYSLFCGAEYYGPWSDLLVTLHDLADSYKHFLSFSQVFSLRTSQFSNELRKNISTPPKLSGGIIMFFLFRN